jgi:hypothetical protein
MRSASVGVSMAALRECVMVDDGWVMVHSLLDRWPWRMILPWRNTYNLFLVNSALHPASQSWPIDRRDPDANDGNRWTVRAVIGRCGMSSSPMCVARIVSLLGRRTVMPVLVGRVLMTGIAEWTYWFFVSCSKK